MRARSPLSDAKIHALFMGEGFEGLGSGKSVEGVHRRATAGLVSRMHLLGYGPNEINTLLMAPECRLRWYRALPTEARVKFVRETRISSLRELRGPQGQLPPHHRRRSSQLPVHWQPRLPLSL